MYGDRKHPARVDSWVDAPESRGTYAAAYMAWALVILALGLIVLGCIATAPALW